MIRRAYRRIKNFRDLQPCLILTLTTCKLLVTRPTHSVPDYEYYIMFVVPSVLFQRESQTNTFGRNYSYTYVIYFCAINISFQSFAVVIIHALTDWCSDGANQRGKTTISTVQTTNTIAKYRTLTSETVVNITEFVQKIRE